MKEELPGIFNVRERQSAEVAFNGFATNAEQRDTESVDASENDQSYTDLLIKATAIRNTFRESVYISESGDKIFHDMIKVFKKKRFANRFIDIDFLWEDAIGDGVTKDAFSLLRVPNL